MAQHAELLSLPDEVLALVAPMTSDDKTWARAATTCKKLWEMQISACPPLHSWKSEASKVPAPFFDSLASGADSTLPSVQLVATYYACLQHLLAGYEFASDLTADQAPGTSSPSL